MENWKCNPLFGSEVLRRIVSLRRPVQILNCAVVVVQCFLLAGCASPNFLANLYLASFALTATETTKGFTRLEIRVGHFFLCARTDESSDWTCGNPDRMRVHLLGITEPWNLYKTAYDLRDRAISPSLNIILLTTMLLSILVVSSFPLVRLPDETVSEPISDVPSRSRRIQQVIFAICPVCSIASSLLAALWQHIVAATAVSLMTFLSSGAIAAGVGPAATALAWLSFYISLITGCICLRAKYVMRIRYFDDEDLDSVGSSSHSTVASWASGVVEWTGADNNADIEMSSLREEGSGAA